MKKVAERIVSILLVVVFLYNVLPMDAMGRHGTSASYGGYDVSIIRNDDVVVTECVEGNSVYTLTFDTEADTMSLVKASYPISFLGLKLGTPEKTNYNVDVESYADDALIADVVNTDSPDDSCRIDDTMVDAQASLVIVPTLGAAATALLYATLATAATVVVAGVTYYAADKVISRLKQKQSSVRYYKAYLWTKKNKVMIGPRISYSTAVTILRSGGNVFATTRNYAYNAAYAASPIRRVCGPEKHGDSGYYWHYHPGRYYSRGKPQHWYGNHCWYAV